MGQVVQWFCSIGSFSHKAFFYPVEGHYPSWPIQAESQTFPYFGDEKNTELKSKQRHFNKWHRSSLHVPVLTATPKVVSSNWRPSSIWLLHLGVVGAAGCSPLYLDKGRGWLIGKASLSTYLVPGLGRLIQLRLEWWVLSVHMSFSVWLCLHVLSIWRLQGDGSSYMIAEASKEKQAGIAWLFLM